MALTGLVFIGIASTVLGQPDLGYNIQHASSAYPKLGDVLLKQENKRQGMWNIGHLSDPYAHEISLEHHFKRRDGMFGNFDPNQFNSQIGANFNPNMAGMGGTSGGSSGSGMFNMMGGGSNGGTGMSMFNPNAMMSGGGSTTGSSGGSQTSSGSTSGSMTGGPSSMTGSSGSIPSYDPNNVINTGAKYDPNAANSGPGTGGSSPSFANGMGLNASQNIPSGGMFGSPTGGGPSSGGSQSTSAGGGSSSMSNPAASFGSSSNPSSSFGSSSGSASSFGSAPGTSGTQSGSSSGSTQTSGSGSSSQSGGMGPMTGGPSNSAPPGTSGTGTSGGGTGTPNFDPVATNSMATSGFNPLNPMMGKDMSLVMGPQAQSGGSTGSMGNFNPGQMNAQLGKQGMSLNMFGGAGGSTDLNKADASAVMTGAQGMMAGSNAINNGGNTVMQGGNTGMGTGMGTSGGSSSGSSTFDPNQMTSSGSSGGSSTGSTGASTGGSSGSGGMSMFNPNAMMGGGSVNPMMPGSSGGMNPMMPGSSGGMNPMMPGSSMTGMTSNTGTRGSSTGGSNPASPNASPLDPLGAMTEHRKAMPEHSTFATCTQGLTGRQVLMDLLLQLVVVFTSKRGAKNFSGGNNMMDPMGFMGGGGLTGSMGNMFSLNGRSINAAYGQPLQTVRRKNNGIIELLSNSVGSY